MGSRWRRGSPPPSRDGGDALLRLPLRRRGRRDGGSWVGGGGGAAFRGGGEGGSPATPSARRFARSDASSGERRDAPTSPASSERDSPRRGCARSRSRRGINSVRERRRGRSGLPRRQKLEPARDKAAESRRALRPRWLRRRAMVVARLAVLKRRGRADRPATSPRWPRIGGDALFGTDLTGPSRPTRILTLTLAADALLLLLLLLLVLPARASLERRPPDPPPPTRTTTSVRRSRPRPSACAGRPSGPPRPHLVAAAEGAIDQVDSTNHPLP